MATGTVTAVLLAVLMVAALSNMLSSANRLAMASPEVVVAGGRLHHAMSRSAVAAEQHENPLLALKEVCFAKAYLRALKTLMTDNEINASYAINIRRMAGELDEVERGVCARLPAGLLPETSVAAGEIP